MHGHGIPLQGHMCTVAAVVYIYGTRAHISMALHQDASSVLQGEHVIPNLWVEPLPIQQSRPDGAQHNTHCAYTESINKRARRSSAAQAAQRMRHVSPGSFPAIAINIPTAFEATTFSNMLAIPPSMPRVW